MLLSILGSGDPKAILLYLLISLPVILFALSAHEAAHGYAAWKCGDYTAYSLGRLTLNPLKHLDPIGFLCMLLFGYGWAKPVPINTRAFRNPKRGMAISSLAGPLANLLIGLVSAVLFGVFSALQVYLTVAKAESTFLLNCLYWLTILLELSTMYNFLLMAFNLIPIPPFDGSRVAFVFLPPRYYFGIMRYERQILIGLMVALLVLSRFGFSPFSWIAEQLTFGVANPIYRLTLNLLLA